MAEKLPDNWMPRKELLRFLGISGQAFAKWGVEPVGKRGRETFFDLRDVIDNRVRRAAQRDNPAAGDPDGVDLRKKRAEEEYAIARERRIGQQLKNEIASGKVVPVDFATFALSRVASQVGTILDTLPLTIRRSHPDLEPRHIESITKEIAIARNAAAGLDEILPELADEYADHIAEPDS